MSSSIIPLQACKLAGIKVRGFERIDGRSGGIHAASVTVNDDVDAYVVMRRDGLTVRWYRPGDDWSYVHMTLAISDDGDFKLEIRSADDASQLEDSPDQPIWHGK